MKAGDSGECVPETAIHRNFETLENLKMKSTSVVLAATLAGAVALPFALGTSAQAGPAAKPDFKFEKCYGVVKAGKNDCQTANSACAGTAAEDGQKDAWVYVPKGTCDKLVGGSTKSG